MITKLGKASVETKAVNPEPPIDSDPVLVFPKVYSIGEQA